MHPAPSSCPLEPLGTLTPPCPGSLAGLPHAGSRLAERHRPRGPPVFLVRQHGWLCFPDRPPVRDLSLPVLSHWTLECVQAAAHPLP